MTITLNDRNPPRPALRARLAGWLRGPTFTRDIAIVLAIKFVLLMALKYTFFNGGAHVAAARASRAGVAVRACLAFVPR
jgi:hypothetical protein